MVTGDVTLLTEPLSESFLEIVDIATLRLHHNCSVVWYDGGDFKVIVLYVWANCLYPDSWILSFISHHSSLLSSMSLRVDHSFFSSFVCHLYSCRFIVFFVPFKMLSLSLLSTYCLSFLPWSEHFCPVLSQTANVALFFSGSVFMCQEVLVLGIIRY